MAAIFTEKLNDSKLFLVERRQRLQENLTQRRELLVQKTTDLRSDIERRRDLTVGRLRTQSLDRLYDLGALTFTNVADLIARLQDMTPIRIGLLDQGADELRSRAEGFTSARQALQHPAIENYDALNVASVNGALAALNAYDLDVVYKYEMANKNRVTVLREIERLLNGEEA